MIELILLKYPGIQYVTVWHTKPDGTPWNDPYEGLLWENKNIPKPTKQDLAEWAIEFDLKLRQDAAVAKREYPPLNCQLDMLYHDSMSGTTTWLDAISAVKAFHPKPLE